MAYCPNCAALLDPAQKFCSRCGQPSAVASVAAPIAVPQSVAGDQSPVSVRIAIAIFLISCAVGIVSVINIVLNYPRAATPTYLTRSIGFDILWILFVLGLWQRQNWARFAILVFIAWGLGTLGLSMMRVVSSGGAAFGFAIPLSMAAARLVAAYLMFRPESNAWFKK